MKRNLCMALLCAVLFSCVRCSVNEHSEGENQYVQLKNKAGKTITFTHFSADTASWRNENIEIRDGDTGHLFVRGLNGDELHFKLRYNGSTYSGETGKVSSYYDYVITIYKEGESLKCRTDKNDEIHVLVCEE